MFSSNIVRQCNGLIVDGSNNYQVASYSFKKFFDYVETDCVGLDTFDWSSAQVQLKHDGSSAVLYFYDGKWHVASRRKFLKAVSMVVVIMCRYSRWTRGCLLVDK